MPLIKRGSPVEAASRSERVIDHVLALRSEDADTRWKAARSLGTDLAAVSALAEALAKEDVPKVREAIVTALMRTGGEESIKTLLPYLRSQDAGMRTAAIDALQALPDDVSPFMQTLLKDPDSDVRILATELVRRMPAGHATGLLAGLLQNEAHPNVCSAAVEVLSELGTRDALPALRACEVRFAAAPFLPFAINEAIARISKVAD
jgi:HEAT repeats